MATNASKSDLAFLDQCKIAFKNSEQNLIIKTQLETVGYDESIMTEGRTLSDNAQTKYDNHQTAENNKLMLYQVFSNKEEEVKHIYSTHRKRAKIGFEDQETIKIQLDLVKPIPTKYLQWVQVVKVFYTEALATPAIQTGLATLKITAEDLTYTQELIAPLEASYVDYKNAVGTAEESTREKNATFYTLDVWMRKFYKVAAVALEDNPQLIESLGKHIPS